METVLKFLLLVLVDLTLGQSDCCKKTQLGGVTYTFLGEEDTSAFSCLNKCTYMKEGEANSKYCFAAGDGGENKCMDPEVTTPSAPGTSQGPSPSSAPAGGASPSSAPAGEASPSSAPAGGASPSSAPAGGTATTAPSSGGATSPSSSCKCGIKRTARILGGNETEINEYPWMTAIATPQGGQFCGGTLIASQWVLTAAHCMFKDKDQTIPYTAAEIRAVLGEHDDDDETESKIGEQVVEVSKIINHKDYDKPTLNNDITLLKLKEEVDLKTYTPACLPNTGDNFAGKKAWVYGWGATAFEGESSSKLLELQVSVVSKAVCKEAMPEQGITDAMLCAGGEKNKDSCQGDSGGPLTVDVAGQHVLIGDVSFGEKCGLEGKYGVYGDVAYFRAWIDSTISENDGAKYCQA